MNQNCNWEPGQGVLSLSISTEQLMVVSQEKRNDAKEVHFYIFTYSSVVAEKGEQEESIVKVECNEDTHLYLVLPSRS